ncbi:unnamed protein product [Thelazia callipaeda]|uniref:Neurotransmitter-gated ion-channel ligand-binding domain-containing protein n=1 Tax=Thelazia callipaeda TaxID=103827 RepID=A0A158RCJ0_THECL|nr:unnamed protein product [Thelazia callipaeda]
MNRPVSMLSSILPVLLYVVSQLWVVNDALPYIQLCDQYPFYPPCRFQLSSEKRNENREFIRLRRNEFNPSTYDYIRFGKKSSGFQDSKKVSKIAVELPHIPNRREISDDHLKQFGISDEQRLFRRITNNYDISVRPVRNASTVVNVYMGLTLTHIFNIDERNQVLALNVWVEQNWHDERIQWDPTEFGNISKLTLGTQYLWTPDIVLYNNTNDPHIYQIIGQIIRSYKLAAQWAPPAKVYSICKLDVRFFPFDDQLCILEFGSWIYDQSQLDVQIMERFDGKDPFTRDSFMENGEWEIVANRTRKVLRGRQTIFPTIVFELHLRRRVLFFIYNVIVPCVMLSVLTMMQFVLPCESGEKITLGLTVLLAYSVFSFNIAENMPETSEVIPLIAIYLMGIMGISGLSVCLSVLVLNMRHGAAHNYRAPKWLHFIAYRILGQFFGKSSSKTRRKPVESIDDTKDIISRILMKRIEKDNEQEVLIEEWNYISGVFDRFFFCCIFFLTGAATLTLLLLAPRFSHRDFDWQV